MTEEYKNIRKILEDLKALQDCILNCSSKLTKMEYNNMVKKTTSMMEEITTLSLTLAEIKGENNILKFINFKGKPAYNNSNAEIMVVEPKSSQTSEITKKEIQKEIDPAKTGITGIKLSKEGKIILEIKNKNIESAKDQIEEKLGEKFIVKIPKKRYPCIKIVGLTLKYNEEEIIEKIMKQNDYMDGYTPRKIHVSNIKKHSYKMQESYTVYVEVDGETYTKIIKNEKINIGWERCRVYDALNVRRCYKCYGFNHKESDCKHEKPVCPKCTGDHKAEVCTMEKGEHRCNNCIKMIKKLNINIDPNHAAWSYRCPVYIKRMETEKSKIFF